MTKAYKKFVSFFFAFTQLGGDSLPPPNRYGFGYDACAYRACQGGDRNQGQHYVPRANVGKSQPIRSTCNQDNDQVPPPPPHIIIVTTHDEWEIGMRLHTANTAIKSNQ